MRSFTVLFLSALAVAEPLALEKRQAACQNTVSSECAKAASTLDLTPCIQAACSSNCQSAVPQFKTCCANPSDTDSVLNCLTQQAGTFGAGVSPAVSSAVSSVDGRVSSALATASAALSSVQASASAVRSSVVASVTAGTSSHASSTQAATSAARTSTAASATATGAAGAGSIIRVDTALGLFAGLVGLAVL